MYIESITMHGMTVAHTGPATVTHRILPSRQMAAPLPIAIMYHEPSTTIFDVSTTVLQIFYCLLRLKRLPRVITIRWHEYNL